MTNTNQNNDNEEPATAPEPDRWYDFVLGPSFKDPLPSPTFCTLRYEFKPASVDKNQQGTLHKSKDNMVKVEFQNNQLGKPKVTFEGVSEDYRENEAILFFDGESFQLEQLHRAVKRLRHVRLPDEAAVTSAAATSAGMAPEACVLPVGKIAKNVDLNKDTVHQEPVEIEKINVGKSESLASISEKEKDIDHPHSLPNLSIASPEQKNFELEEYVDILNEDDDNSGLAKLETFTEKEVNTGIDINLPNTVDTDDEIADVDVNGEEVESGRNAAEALRAQVTAEGREESSSTSKSSSVSGSSTSETGSGTGSGSGSSSHSETSDGNSVNSV